MVMPTCMDRSMQAAAVVEKPEKGRALIVFRSEEEAEKYRSDTGKHPASDGWGPAALDLEDLANVLEMPDCTRRHAGGVDRRKRRRGLLRGRCLYRDAPGERASLALGVPTGPGYPSVVPAFLRSSSWARNSP